MSTTQQTSSPIGLYQVNGIAGNEGTPGAPILHFSLLVNAATGAVTGHAQQTQAVPPPGDKIDVSNVTGRVRSTGLGEYTKVVALRGSAVISFPPPAIGSYLAPFEAHFAIDDSWNGTGGWSLGNTDVDDVPVRSVED